MRARSDGVATIRPAYYLVDNELTEATRRVLSAVVPADDLLCSIVNLGYAGGTNLGIERARAVGDQYVLLLNTDAEIAAADVSRLLDTLKTHPEISIVAPVICEDDDGRVRCLVGGRDIARHSITRVVVSPGDVNDFSDYPIHDVDYVSGTAFMVRMSVLDEVGLLDEEYFFSGEIADFCKRAKDRGKSICVDLKAEARHDTGETSVDLRETLYVYYGLRNRFLYVRKHHPAQRIRYFVYWTVLGVAGLVRAVMRGKIDRARAIMLALLHAYCGRYGNQNNVFL